MADLEVYDGDVKPAITISTNGKIIKDKGSGGGLSLRHIFAPWLPLDEDDE